MEVQNRPKVISQDHAHIHPAKCVCLDHNRSSTQYRRHRSCTGRIPAAHDDPCQALRGISVAKEDNIHTVGAEHPRCRPCHSLAASAVQHLNHQTSFDRRNGVGLTRFRRSLRPEQEPAEPGEQDERDNQGEPDPAATRLFQNRTVGSSIGHPLLMR
jgi:hypothetical protein